MKTLKQILDEAVAYTDMILMRKRAREKGRPSGKITEIGASFVPGNVGQHERPVHVVPNHRIIRWENPANPKETRLFPPPVDQPQKVLRDFNPEERRWISSLVKKRHSISARQEQPIVGVKVEHLPEHLKQEMKRNGYENHHVLIVDGHHRDIADAILGLKYRLMHIYDPKIDGPIKYKR